MAARVHIDETFARAIDLAADEDPFARIAALDGEVFRAVERRRTFRIDAGGTGWFIKEHRGVGWREIAKNLLSLRLPVLGAAREARAAARLQAAGVAALRVAAWGERGANPARRQSFLVSHAIEHATDLETAAVRWQAAPLPFRQRRRLVRRIGALAGAMHRAGVAHRDFYLCHLLLERGDPEAPLHLIDLHRARVGHGLPPLRWRAKDLGALWFSAHGVALSRADRMAFVAAYTGGRPAAALRAEPGLWRRVAQRARRLLGEGIRKGIAPPGARLLPDTTR